MSDVKDFAAYEHHQKALTEANAVNKAAVFDELSKAGITRVLADFDGEGDSGQLNNIAAYRGDQYCPIPDASIELRQVSFGGAHTSRTVALYEAIDALCYDYLAQEHGGWENNDGAFGEFVFDVASRRIELDFNARYSDSVHSSHSF